MRTFFLSLMTDKKQPLFYAPLIWALSAVSLLYGMAIAIRAILYRAKIFRRRAASIKVISVGNLSLGGTGKTPFTIALARILKDELKREVAVLTRGYGWDEQALLKMRLPDIPVIVGENRVRSARKAIRLYGADTAVLDDGFQYWELARDLDIVLIDSRSPFGNGHLVPRGTLREPKRSLARADVVIFTKAGSSTAGLDAVRRDIRALRPDIVFAVASHRPTTLYDIRSKAERPVSSVAGKPVVLLSSIADPGYFEETVRSLGCRVAAHFAYADHHDYRAKDIDSIAARCAGVTFDHIITTEKDAVKLSRLGFGIAGRAVLALAVEAVITRGREDLIARLHRLYTG